MILLKLILKMKSFMNNNQIDFVKYGLDLKINNKLDKIASKIIVSKIHTAFPTIINDMHKIIKYDQNEFSMELKESIKNGHAFSKNCLSGIFLKEILSNILNADREFLNKFIM